MSTNSTKIGRAGLITGWHIADFDDFSIKSMWIKKGKLVKQGDIIGYVGTSGRSTGPHLHYEVKHKNRTINPMKLRLQPTINVEEQDMSNFYASISLARERFLATQFTESEGAENF